MTMMITGLEDPIVTLEGHELDLTTVTNESDERNEQTSETRPASGNIVIMLYYGNQ